MPRETIFPSSPAYPAPYKKFGSHSVIPGQRYMNAMHTMTISMYGIMPEKI